MGGARFDMVRNDNDLSRAKSSRINDCDSEVNKVNLCSLTKI
ncbi:MAG: hypothetical protein N2252_03460 [Candidatus Kryptonium sp.]|nr:hypothetical protein [Candidatus Kryptonium sp.]